VEQRGRIPSLDLLAMLHLMQPRIPLAFWAGRIPHRTVKKSWSLFSRAELDFNVNLHRLGDVLPTYSMLGQKAIQSSSESVAVAY